MDIKYIKERIRTIRYYSSDDEMSHSLEDGLYEEFVRHVAKESAGDMQKMAKEVLKTQRLKFARWCA